MKVTIEAHENPDTLACSFEVTDERGCTTGPLDFDEMLGQVVCMCHPQLCYQNFPMHTPEEWERLRASITKGPAP